MEREQQSNAADLVNGGMDKGVDGQIHTHTHQTVCTTASAAKGDLPNSHSIRDSQIVQRRGSEGVQVGYTQRERCRDWTADIHRMTIFFCSFFII